MAAATRQPRTVRKAGQMAGASLEALKVAVRGFRARSVTEHTHATAPKGAICLLLKTYGKDTLRPVTIKQVLDAQQPHPDAEFKIDDVEITQVNVIMARKGIWTAL